MTTMKTVRARQDCRFSVVRGVVTAKEVVDEGRIDEEVDWCPQQVLDFKGLEYPNELKGKDEGDGRDHERDGYPEHRP